MRGLDLAQNVGLRLYECETFSEPIECLPSEFEKILREKFYNAIFVAWQVQSIIWGKFDGKKILVAESTTPNVEDWLECRIFNECEELHLKREGELFSGRYIRDEVGSGKFYVDSFARLWGENSSEADGWIKLVDTSRKLSMTIPCNDYGKKFYGLKTRNYIDSDETTGLSGYVDYRFVAIESAWDGD